MGGDVLHRTVVYRDGKARADGLVPPTTAAAQDPALKSFLDGVELTERELLNVLERHGVTRIDPIGQRFDPASHSAMIVAADGVKIRRPVVPGDQLLLEVDRFRHRSRMVEAFGVARVGDQVVAEARLRFIVLKADLAA